ncbi:MAG: hypothetical protein ABI790_10935, partial [Betaproteobacteria bacterium]
MLRPTVRSVTGLRLFYAALVALSLMLGKYCLASTPEPAVVTIDRTPAVTLVVSPLPDNPAADRELISARDAFEKHQLRNLASARDRFRSAYADYPLAGYVEYWWLLANLAQGTAFGSTNAADFSAFLAAQPDGVLAESLRKEWLRALGKLERWDLFAPEFQRLNVDDADLTCHQWRYRIGQGDRSAFGEVRAFWNTARPASDACYEVFDQLRAGQRISAESAWSRVRKLLEDNQIADARRSAALIDKLPPTFERLTASIGLNPAAYVEKQKPLANSRASIELYLYALNRLARSDAGKAAAALSRWSADLPAADREYAWTQVGFLAAMQHDTSALAWFGNAGSFPLNDIQASWKARAALRAGDWTAVRAAIGAMSRAERREPAWRYWLARAETAAGNEPGAAKLREALARENNFYGLLAAEDAGLPAEPNWKGWKPSPAELASIAQRPAIQRALLLYRLDLKSEGLREWQFAIRDMNDQQ